MQGDLPRAVAAFEKALNIWTHVLNEQNEAVAEAYGQLGDIYRRQAECVSRPDALVVWSNETALRVLTDDCAILY